MRGLSSSQVFLPLCHALVVGRLNVLFFSFFFFLLNLSFTGFTFAGGEFPHLLSDSRIETSSQTKRKQVCGPNKVDKKELQFRIRLGDSEVTLWYFFKQWLATFAQSLKKVKKCKKVKVKAFFSRWSNRRRLPSSLDGRCQKSRSSLIEPWLGGFLRISLGISPALFFFRKMLSLRNIRKQAKKKEGKKSLEDLAASVSPVTDSQGVLPNFLRPVSDDRKTPTIRTGNSGRHTKEGKLSD